MISVQTANKEYFKQIKHLFFHEHVLAEYGLVGVHYTPKRIYVLGEPNYSAYRLRMNKAPFM